MRGFEDTLPRTSYTEVKYDFQIGTIMFNEDLGKYYLEDSQSKTIEISRIYFLNKSNGVEEGTKDLIRPRVITNSGEIKKYGEKVLYNYLNSTDQAIVVFGPVQQLYIDNADPELRVDLTSLDSIEEKVTVRSNESRYFYFKDDGKGNITLFLNGKNQNGNMALKIVGDGEEAGNLKLEVNGKLLLNITGETDGEETVLAQQYFDKEKFRFIDRHKNEMVISETGVSLIDLNNNKIITSKEGTVIESPKIDIRNQGGAESLLKLLKDLIDAILKMTQGTAAGGPTIATKFNETVFKAIINRIDKFLKV
jgi:hypothetical protein